MFCNRETSFVRRKAPDSSRWGIVSHFNGATFDLEAMSLVVISPILFVVQRYTAAAKVC